MSVLAQACVGFVQKNLGPLQCEGYGPNRVVRLSGEFRMCHASFCQFRCKLTARLRNAKRRCFHRVKRKQEITRRYARSTAFTLEDVFISFRAETRRELVCNFLKTRNISLPFRLDKGFKVKDWIKSRVVISISLDCVSRVKSPFFFVSLCDREYRVTMQKHIFHGTINYSRD